MAVVVVALYERILEVITMVVVVVVGSFHPICMFISPCIRVSIFHPLHFCLYIFISIHLTIFLYLSYLSFPFP